MLEVDVYELNDIICYLSGDSAYALAMHTMKPYPDNENNIKRIRDYNYMHSATRVSVENSIGRLKGKWRRLKGVRSANPTRLRLLIRAAIVLHNFCLKHDSDPLPPSSPSPITRLPTGHNAVNKRDNICKWLARQNWTKAACLLSSKIYYLCQYKLHIFLKL